MAAPYVSFIGSGNLAWHLAPALDNAGYVVKEVHSRNEKHGRELTRRLYQAEWKTSLDFSDSPSGIFIIAVSDDSIEAIAREIILPEEAILAHTSGSQPVSLLGFSSTPHIGVFYPLQTFSKIKKVNFSEVPIFLESETPEAANALKRMAGCISKVIREITEDERKALHVAAVFASNFTNHLLTISQDLLKEYDLSFELLKPLITETLNKSLDIRPENAQTGPAQRGDFGILETHMDFLKSHPSLAEIYKHISQHIIDRHPKN